MTRYWDAMGRNDCPGSLRYASVSRLARYGTIRARGRVGVSESEHKNSAKTDITDIIRAFFRVSDCRTQHNRMPRNCLVMSRYLLYTHERGDFITIDILILFELCKVSARCRQALMSQLGLYLAYAGPGRFHCMCELMTQPMEV